MLMSPFCSGIQDGTEQKALEHGQTVTSRALVVESSVTTRTLVDHNFSLAFD